VSDEGVVVVNFGHPLVEAQREQVEALTGEPIARVLDAPAHADLEREMGPQVVALVDRVGLTIEEWQTVPLVINPPGLALLNAVLLAELHGRMGHFPTLLRMRPMPRALPPRYDVVELVDLQEVRDAARSRR
jgi:hypothetical protein